MKDSERKEKIEDIYQDLLVCKDSLTHLCNQTDDSPALHIGFELGAIYMIILRILGDIEEIK